MPTSRYPHLSTPGLLLAPLLVLSTAVGQREVRAPIGIQPSLTPTAPPSEDPGRPPRLVESTNVDRFLRRAQEALARGDDRAAIRILQEVIEGRTLADPIREGADPIREGADPIREGADPIDEGADPDGEGGAAGEETEAGGQPEHAVFSTDGRLYRPVRRLCQELLASLSPESIDYYRTLFEVTAEQACASASADHDVAGIERVFETWFVTRTAARAMLQAGDLRMDAGAYRAAIRDYQLLLEVYPAGAREEAGIDETWVRFKVALCLRLLGDRRSALDQLARLASDVPDATLRVGGDLWAIADLAESPWFDEVGATRTVDAPRFPAGTVTALNGARETLVPLWEQRFIDSQPYRPARGSEERRLVIGLQGGSDGAAATPRAAQYSPGTTAWLGGGTLAFLDHYRLRRIELPSGRAIGIGDGPVEQPTPKPGVPRVRIAAYDYVTQRVAADERRFYAVIGPGRRQLSGLKPVLTNELEAMSAAKAERLWTTAGREEFKDVTFLAAPTVSGDRLLVPTARAGSFGLDCIRTTDGALLFRVPLHSEGTDLARPIAPPVVVEAGIAYLLTGAGAIGAVDVHTGSLRWVRRYERVHPLRARPRIRPKQREGQMLFSASMFQETDLSGFAPSDLLIREGMVVLAPCDGDVLLCLDGATGEPVWMLSRKDMQYLIGADGGRLFVGAPDGVYCVDLRSGIRLWRRDLPPHHRSMEWRGRGTVGREFLALPGERAIHLLPLAGGSGWTTLELPGFGLGREPLDGRFNLLLDGPWVVAVHEGGVQLFSTIEAMHALADAADDPYERALVLAQTGDLLGAVAALESVDRGTRPELADAIERRMLAWSSELAIAMASHGEREEALAVLDRCRVMITSAGLIGRWHLERVEVFRALGDLDAISREQDALLDLPRKD